VRNGFNGVTNLTKRAYYSWDERNNGGDLKTEQSKKYSVPYDPNGKSGGIRARFVTWNTRWFKKKSMKYCSRKGKDINDWRGRKTKCTL